VSIQPNKSPIRRATYVVLAISLIAGFTAGQHLTLLTNDTESTFAWHIRNPLTAAFFGAAYTTAGIAVGITMWRARRWEELRPAGVVTATFITLAGLITVVHFDEFQYDSSEPVARFVSWVWLVLYFGLPLPLVWSVLRQEKERIPGSYFAARPLIRGFRVAFLVTGTVLAVAGLGMVLNLQPLLELWPWALPPLSARVAGG